MTTTGHFNKATGISSFYDKTNNSTYTTNLWKTCPLLEHLHDPWQVKALDEQFTSYNAAASTGDYLLTQATAGSAAMATTTPLALLANSGATTSTQGPNIQRLKSGFVPAAGKDIWAEFKFTITSSTLKFMTYIGLAESNTAVIASSALANINGIGVSSVTGDGVMLLSCTKASTATTAASFTAASGTSYKWGFFYDGTADTVQQYVNGAAVGSAIATTYIPKVIVYPTLVIQSAGTDQPTLLCNGFRIVQRA